MRILLAEDDGELAANLIRLLHGEAFAVDWARNGADALHFGKTGDYDCCLLDLGLPELEGQAVLEGWRRGGRDFPVLVLTARDGWLDKAAAFSLGADDYVTKPFLSQELVMRVRALMRRARGQKAETIRCGDLAYQPMTGDFHFAGQPLHLTAFETRLLAKLIQFRENVVPRELLIESLYEAESEVPLNSLEVLIGRLRRKIGARMIVTMRGHGYRLTAKPA